MKKINEILTDFGYRALIHDKELIINYNDIKNNTTERKITLKSVKRIFDDFLLTAYCHLRKSNRTFKLSNISLLVDNSSGEVIDNFSDYFSTLDIIEIVEEDSNYEKYYTEDYFTEIFKRRESKFNNNSLDKLCSLFEYEEGSIEVKKTRLSIEYYNKEKDEILKISRELIEIDRNGGYEFNLFFHWIDILE